MTIPGDSVSATPDEPVAGERLLIPPTVTDHPAALVEPVDPINPVDTSSGPDSSAQTAVVDEHEDESADDAPDQGGSKIKAAALLAGAAAIANKVRQEAPKKVQEFRDKRAVGRCVIVTKVDGRYLAIGPYKDDAAAQQDMFRIGGTPHVAELTSDTAFFAPPAP